MDQTTGETAIPGQSDLVAMPIDINASNSGFFGGPTFPEFPSFPGQETQVEAEKGSGIEIEVKNPTLVNAGVMSKTYIVYDVEGSDKHGTFSVKRRFKDFFELRTRLVENWPGVLVPPLPEKKIQGNTDSEFVLERKSLLDYFVKRCSGLSYIYYSDEMQSFLRLGDEQFKREFSIKKVANPVTILRKYVEAFPDESGQSTTDETIESVDKYFDKLKHTDEFYMNFLKLGGWYSKKKKQNTIDFLIFIKHAVGDYKRKLTPEQQALALEKYNDFLEDCTKDEMKSFLGSLKELSLEFKALLDLKVGLKTMIRMAEENRRKETDIEREITKVRLSDSDQVKTSMFGGKVSKDERLKDLQDQLKEAKDYLEAWMKLRGVVYNILNFREFPKVIAMKNSVFSKVLQQYYENRRNLIKSELGMLREIESHYEQYCTK